MKEYSGTLQEFWETGMEDTTGLVFVSDDEEFWYPSNHVRCSICGALTTKEDSESKTDDEHEWEVYPQFPKDPKHNGMYVSYEASCYLHDGDYLTILSPTDGSIVWEGEIRLNQGYGQIYSSMWTGWQEGVSENEWLTFFLLEYPARLKTDSWF